MFRYVKLLMLTLVAACALNVARNYTDQLRYQLLAFRPCDVGICVMYFDQRTGDLFWMPVPEPPAKNIIPGVDRGPKVGI